MLLRRPITLVALAASLMAGCAAAPSGPGSEVEQEGWPGTVIDIELDQIRAGKIIAERECAACHAVDAYANSKNPAAPPLRDVLAVNDPEFLAYRLIDAMRIGHDDMPLFDFNVRAADALIAYIKSITR
jgi:mono/diheme cytochrome c family protein